MVLYEIHETGDTYALSTYGANYHHAQGFKIGLTGPNEDHTIDSIELLIYRRGSPGTITVGIYNATWAGHPTGSPLCSGTYNGNDLSTSKAWISFSLSPPVTLKAGTRYAMQISAPNGDINNAVLWRSSSDSSYGGGYECTWRYSGGMWWYYGSKEGDFLFKEYGTSVSLPDLCTWLADHGAPLGITSLNVYELVNSYTSGSNVPEYDFCPTSLEIYGTVQYYNGEDGDSNTGCDFFP